MAMKIMKKEGKEKFYAKKIKNLSSALSIIDIENFFHIRVIDGEKFFVLSNKEKIVDFFHKRNIDGFFEKIIKKAIYGKISFYLWPLQKSDFILNNMVAQNVKNGISVSLRLSNYVDIFSFSSTSDNHNFYLNHLNLLKRFVIYFRLKAKDVIDEISHSQVHLLARRIDFNDKVTDHYLEDLNDFRRQILPLKLTVQDSGRQVKLSPKETQYLLLMLEGKSMNKIAEELGVSHRTVESSLENIKLKMGYTTKARLIADFFEQQLYQPSIHYGRYN